MDENTTIIENVLRKNPQDIAFEPIPPENDSPLSQAVVQKNSSPASTNVGKTEPVTTIADPAKNTEKIPPVADKNQPDSKIQEQPVDAPEQPIDEPPGEQHPNTSSEIQEPEFTMPVAEATTLANTILGIVNNTVLEVGAGYFITIKKHSDFYEFDELIQVIDEANVKNIKRMKLDEEDKAMLRPLLIMVLRRKSKVLSPEAQLLGVGLSIIIKKAKIVMEIRAENELLVDRIRDIIRKELGAREEEEKQDEEQEGETTALSHSKNKDEEINSQDTQQNKATNNTGLPPEVLETTD